jgi:hypothetical protein
MAKKAKQPRDISQGAKNIVDFATDETKDTETSPDVRLAAAALGRLGGLKGGKARAKVLSAKRRSEIAKAAAAARWGHTKK